MLLAQGISKRYKVFESPFQRLTELLFSKGRYKEVRAVSDVSFRLDAGETVGIVGANGSGKSTLLQMVCGTLTPDDGEIIVQGRISALLELGAGFNPELTGLENIYVYGALLGLTREQVEAQQESIERYADIGDFIHEPVKSYSSGMFVRLAFAVAVHVDPQVMIIDEALAVGDEAFQRKCFSTLREMRDRGVTILFVSHSAESVLSLCDRALLMDKGQLLLDASPKEVINQYQKLLYAPADKRAQVRQSIISKHDVDLDVIDDCSVGEDIAFSRHPEYYVDGMQPETTSYESTGAQIQNAMLLDESNRQVNLLRKGEWYTYRYEVLFSSNADNVYAGMLIKLRNGVALGGGSSYPLGVGSGHSVNAGDRRVCEFRFRCALNSDTYFLNAGVAGDIDGEHLFMARSLDLLMFKVMPKATERATASVDFDIVPRLYAK